MSTEVNSDSSILSQWQTPNYINPVERTWLTPIVIVSWAIATTCVILRTFLRIRSQAGGFGYDDVLLILAWAVGTVLSAFMCILIIGYNLGRHAWDVPFQNWSHLAFYHFMAYPMFLVAGCLTKVSILFFYRRLSQNAMTPIWKRALIGCIAFTIFWSLALIIAPLPFCMPIEAYWMRYDIDWLEHHTFSCVHTNSVPLLAGIMAAISDLYATALPCILIMRLQMPKRTKIGLIVVFCLGLVVTAFSIIRTVWIMLTLTGADVSWNMYWEVLFIQLELQLGVICACLPTLNVFVKIYVRPPIDKLLSTRRSKISEIDSNGSSLSAISERKKNIHIHSIVEVADDDVHPVSPLIREHIDDEMYHMTPRSGGLGTQTHIEKSTSLYSPV